MKNLFRLLVTAVLLIGLASPTLEYMKKAHGTHGLGNVNQNFQGVDTPPPWDLPPGSLH